MTNSETTPSIPIPIQDEVSADVVHIQQGGAQTVEATTVNVTQGGIQEVRAEQVTIENGGVGKVNANRLELNNGGIGLAQADHIAIQQGQIGIAAARKITGSEINSFLLFAQRVEGDVNTMITERTAAIGGMVLGAIVGLFLLFISSKRNSS